MSGNTGEIKATVNDNVSLSTSWFDNVPCEM